MPLRIFMSDLQTSNPNTESFAALFEESLTKQDMRAGEVISAEVVRVDHNFVVVNAGLKSEAYIPHRRIPERRGRGRSPGGRLRFGRDRRARKRLWRHASCRATRPSASLRGCRWKRRSTTGELVTGTITRQGQGRPDRHGQRHPRVPAGFARRHASGQGHDAVRRQDARVQGHQARPQAQQRRGVAPRRARSDAWAKSARSCSRR